MHYYVQVHEIEADMIAKNDVPFRLLSRLFHFICFVFIADVGIAMIERLLFE